MINMLPYKNDDNPCEYGINILPVGVEYLDLDGDISHTNITKMSFGTMYFLPERGIYTTKSFRAVLPAQYYSDFVDFNFEDNRMVFGAPLDAGFYLLEHGEGKAVLQVGTTEEIKAVNQYIEAKSVYVLEAGSDLREDAQIQYNSNVFNSSFAKKEDVSLFQNVSVINMTEANRHTFSVSIENKGEWHTPEFNDNLVGMNSYLNLYVTEYSEIAKGTMNITMKILNPNFTTKDPVLLPIYGLDNVMVKI